MLKYFEINKSFMCSSLFRYYIKQIESMLPCVCSVIDHRWRQNVIRTSAIALCATFYSYHILTSSVIYYWTDARQHGIYLLSITAREPVFFSVKQNFESILQQKFVLYKRKITKFKIPIYDKRNFDQHFAQRHWDKNVL